MTRPVKCECGWVLPAAFVVTGEVRPGISTLLFACGNCGSWQTIPLHAGKARTANADGFGNMPKLPEG